MTGRSVLLAAAVGVAVTVAAWVISLRLVDAVVAGVVGAVVTAIGRSVADEPDHPWPRPPVDEPHGARSGVSFLMWSFAGRDGKVSEAALRGLRRQATRRLAGTGIVLADERGYLVRRPGATDGTTGSTGPATADDDARGRAVLGDRAWAVLTSRGDLPALRDVAHCIDVVERLTPDHTERRR